MAVALLDRRCTNHELREAAVECPSCKRSFCRECVVEHDGRMMCSGCVAMLARSDAATERAKRIRWTLAAVGGLLLAWVTFYYLGAMLARIPSQFHTAAVLVGPMGTDRPVHAAHASWLPRPACEAALGQSGLSPSGVNA
jgi:hypothetical protein